MHIFKKRRQHMVQLEMSGGTIDAENVVVVKDKLSFSLQLEGQPIQVALTIEGDTFSGESSSQDGIFQLQGARRK
jgi:hypothetical protein